MTVVATHSSCPSASVSPVREELELTAPAPERQSRRSLTIIGDREIENLTTLLAAARDPKFPISVGGFIAPGFEADWPFMCALPQLFPDQGGMLTPLEMSEKVQSAEAAITGSEPTDFAYYNPSSGQCFQFRHQPYSAAELKDRGDTYRAEYCADLARAVRETGAEMILLSNFKLVLARAFAEEFAGKITNIHPSVLPQLKGWRSENRAVNLLESPEACGYTIHNVSSDLDGGATYFQQRLGVPAKDAQLEATLGTKAYADLREETMRWAIIREQALWTPQVLELVASNTPRKTVLDEEAFAAEGRAGFSSSDGFIASMREDYQHWAKTEGDASISFEEWQSQHRKSYARVLFDKGQGWQTAEQILGSPRIVELPPQFSPRRSYTFELPGDTLSAMIEVEEILSAVSARELGLVDRTQTMPSRNGCICHVEGSINLDQVLAARGIEFKSHLSSVGVRTPRLKQSAIDLD